MDINYLTSVLGCLLALLSILPETTESLRSGDIRKAVRDAIRTGDETLASRRDKLREFKEKGIDRKGRPSKDKHGIVSKRKKEAKTLAETGLYSIEVMRTLVEETGMTPTQLADHPEVRQEFQQEFCPTQLNCDDARSSPYRTVDGTCNNLNHPEWGAAVQPQPRYQPAQYDDGITSPRSTGKNGQSLPSTRLVSNKLFRAVGDLTENADTQSLMVMVWGQFIDHDITATPVTEGDDVPITCCGDEVQGREDCFPISIPADDSRFSDDCMEFVRSAPAPPVDGCQPGPREQINQLTSFIDGGVVYGDSETSWKQLTDFGTGSMLVSDGDMLPPGGFCLPSHDEDYCQLAGDHRVNEVPTLGGNHLMFLREHNRIADELRRVRPDWGASKVFKETRKIIGALLQQVTYGEFLPAILRKEDLENFNLKLKKTGFSSSYNSSLHPGAKNVFNAAAFRFGHSMVPPSLAYVLHDYMTKLNTTLLESTFFDPHMLITNGGQQVPDLARYIVSSNGMKIDSKFEGAIRDRLFSSESSPGFDLTALNLQRGRDHGLPAYNSWRKWCRLDVASSFSDLKDISDNNKVILADVYSDVDDIDVFAGGMAENPLAGAQIGPLFSCIIGNQFRDIKDGDRYWYENRGEEGFREEQLQEIRKVKLSKILCENLNVDSIQPDVFHVPNPSNDWVGCNLLPGIDFSKWRSDKQPGGGGGGSGGSGGSGGGGSGGRRGRRHS